MPGTDKLILLRNYDLWSQLSEEDYCELNIVTNFRQAKKGEYIYFEAFHHNKLYFLKEGYIRIGHIDNRGNVIIKEILQQGELFGQLTLERENLNGEFAQAYKGDVSLCAFSIADFQRLLQKKPGLALKYGKQVGARLRKVENRLINLLNKDVKTRLVNFLWQLVHTNPQEDDPFTTAHCIPNFLTHEDIARLIGSSRQTVTTLINQLVSEGILTYTRQRICFSDVNELQKRGNVA